MSSITRRSLLRIGSMATAAAVLPTVSAHAEEPAKNRVCQILGIQKPVVQAIMFDMTNAELVAAVSEAGGLGVLSMTTIDQVAEVQALTSKPFAVSSFLTDEDTAAALKDAGVKIICAGTVQFPTHDYGFEIEGLSAGPDSIAFWKDHGFTVLCKQLNATLEGALAIQDAGADILIPVGFGAGGCAPYNTTAAPQLISEFKAGGVEIPMLAAGGIVNYDTAAACAAVGAEGAYCGTRFLATDESNCCDAAKKIIVQTRSEDLVTMPTSLKGEVYSLVPCIKNDLSEKAIDMWRSGATYDEITQFNGTNAQFWASMSAGNIDEWGVGMDRAVNLITSIRPAADIVNEIAGAFGC